LIGIAYDRHPAPALSVKPLLAVTTALLIFAGSWQTNHQFTQELEHYAPRILVHRVTLSTWLASDWEELPMYRVDLEGKNEQPMNFQWAGSLETFQAILEKQGWHSATDLSPLGAMGWLAPEPDISTLPILPQVNNGQHQELLLVNPHLKTDDQLVVLRLWPSNMEILDTNAPVWSGSVVYLYLEQDLPLVAYLRTAPDFETPPNHLMEALSQAGNIGLTHRTRKSANKQIRWDGDVLLFREID